VSSWWIGTARIWFWGESVWRGREGAIAGWYGVFLAISYIFGNSLRRWGALGARTSWWDRQKMTTSDRIRELEANELARRATSALERTRPALGWLGIGLGALAVVVLGWGWWSTQVQKKSAQAWSDFYFASGDPDQLIAVYEDHPDSIAAHWARQTEADSQVARGMDSVYVDREQADTLFRRARSNYSSILEKSNDPMLRARATLGMAQAFEGSGEIDKAIAEYKNVLAMTQVPAAMMAEVQRRMDWLQSPGSKDFYAWYRDFRPAPAAPVNVPGDLKSLPGLPDFQLPPLQNSPGSGTPGAAFDSDSPPAQGSTEAAPAAEATPSPGTPPLESSPGATSSGEPTLSSDKPNG
jgi:hypothetical protein